MLRTENELPAKKIKETFGEGGNLPGLDHRWCRGQTGFDELTKMGIFDKVSGFYYGFRTRDDQVLFYMLFEGKL